MTKKISIVTPCFNEELNIENCYGAVRDLFAGALRDYELEYIFCDNCSTDGTVGKIKSILTRDPRVRLIVNSRNFGPFANLFNGVKSVTGDAVVVFLAADLQDPPEVIPEFVKHWEAGYDVVYGLREQRDEGVLLRLVRRLFYRLLNVFAPFEIPENAGEFQLIDRKVADQVAQFNDHFPFVRAMIAYCGFKSIGVPYRWRRREKGISSNSLTRLFDQGLGGIISFSNVPMRLVLIAGSVTATVSLVAAIVFLVVSAIYYRELAPPGIPLLTIALFFFSGCILFVLGFLGEYILGIHSQVRHRPIVIESERYNFPVPADGMDPRETPQMAADLTEYRRLYAAGDLDRGSFWSGLSHETTALRRLQPMLAGTMLERIEIADGELIVSTRSGVRFIWEPEDVRTAPNIAFMEGAYEPEAFDLLTRLAAGKRTVLDIGANVGWYSLHLAQVLSGDGARVHAFEPVGSTNERLCGNVALNAAGAKIAIYDFGLSDHCGDASFFLPAASGSVAASLRDLHPDETSREVRCRLETADVFLAREEIDRVDLVKCDIEGAELMMLKGASRLLTVDKPVFFMELLRKWSRAFGYQPDDVLKLMAGHGYACWAIGYGTPREIDRVTEDTVETNFLFLCDSHVGERETVAELAAAAT